jgi:hypothetical protein
MPEALPRGDYLNPKEPTISDLGAKSLRPANPPITYLSTPILVQVVPPRMTPYEHQIILQEAMEENDATSSRSLHTPISTTTTWGMIPPNPPSSVQTIVISTPSTSGSGLIPSLAVTTASFTQSATGPPFSYRMPKIDSNSVLTYSTLQAMGLGTWSSNTPMKGSTRGTSMLYLMVGVIYLLRPPRSVVLSSNPSG